MTTNLLGIFIAGNSNFVRDRFGGTALDDAARHRQHEIQATVHPPCKAERILLQWHFCHVIARTLVPDSMAS